MKVREQTKRIHWAAIIIVLGAICSLFSVQQQVPCFLNEKVAVANFADTEILLRAFDQNSAQIDFIVAGEVVKAGTIAVNQPLRSGLTKIFLQGTGEATQFAPQTGQTEQVAYSQLLVRWDFSYYIVLAGMLLLLFFLVWQGKGGRKA